MGAPQRDCHRQHPHDRQAEHGIQRDLPAQVLEHRAEQHGTEDQERDAVERRPGLLGETHHRRNVLAGDQAEQRSGHERGDEPRPPQVDRDPVREHRGGHRDDLPPGIVNQMPSFGHVHDHRGEDARHDAAEQSVADLLDDHAQRVRLAASAGDGRQRDQQQGYADPVVEAALDVERLTHNLRKSRVRDDRAAKPGVGRREDHPKDQRLAERERPKQKHRDQPSEHDRQRQAHAKQTHRHRSLAPQRPQIHTRGIREQHHRERRLGQRPHSRTRGTHRKVIKHQRPHEHADRGHHHRRRDRRARQTPRHCRHEQQRQTDNRKPGIHRSSSSAEAFGHDMRCLACHAVCRR